MRYLNFAFAEGFFEFENISAVKDVVNTITLFVWVEMMYVLDATSRYTIVLIK